MKNKRDKKERMDELLAAREELTEEEKNAMELWEKKRKKIFKKRRRRVILQMILTAAVSATATIIILFMLTGVPEEVSEAGKTIQARVKGLIAASDEQKTTEEASSQKKVTGEENEEKSSDSTDEKSGEAPDESADKESEEELKTAGEESSEEELSAAEEEEETIRRRRLRRAKQYAQQYDYDTAIRILKQDPDYATNETVRKYARKYLKLKQSCVSWSPEQVTHIFYHTLIKDTSKAFDGDYKAGDYDQVMTTIDEFNKITQTMYEKGYVMVSIYDLAAFDENGNLVPGEILLPPGKIPFILSQDDVCYYHYMDGDGFASKLIVDSEGKIRNEYVEDDGSISIGDYDMVPLIDRFVEEHPDFSYKGAKGIIALTGYNGILGYRTDSSYATRPEDLDDVKRKWLEEHPDFNIENERGGAITVAAAMKEEGWVFASHTWGHLNVGEISLERLQADTQRFKENVDPLIGGTDIIIFAFGADLAGIEDYSGEKFEYLKSCGYNYFCNVDSSQYYVQMRDNYFRMGRRNLDGYRMYYNPELVADLFDASQVFDPSRPTPVPPMS